MRRSLPFLLAPLFALPFLTAACPGYNQQDCVDLGTCDCTFDEAGICHTGDGSAEGSTADGAGDADGSVNIIEGGTVDAPPGCDTAKDPKDSLPCVVDSFGVFVDGTSGADSNPGTKEKPFKTIGAAIAGVGAKPRVYICAGTYSENLTLQSALNLYGGFACGSWTYSAASTKVNPSTGVALTLTGVNGSVIEDLEFDGSANPAVPGDSAVAVFASASKVTLTRLVLKAGDGTAGAKGTAGATASNYSGANASNGANANAATPGPQTPCACKDGTTTSTGAKGAAPGAFPDDGISNPAVGASNGGTSGNSSCTDGTTGANGLARTGGAGSPGSGVLSSAGWSSATPVAKPGAIGNPGQGGGGGGAKNTANIAGGGGACGGCGGAGGGPGGNGGSSFGLLSFQSTVTATATSISSGAAGSGGDGGDGQDGQGGGSLGVGACNGGPGGNGAGGSSGGGGSAGYSAAIAYTGTAPSTNMATMKPGSVGIVGKGGQPGAGAGNGGGTGLPGAAGAAMSVLQLP